MSTDMIPNSPSPVSGLPRAQTLTASDLLLLIQANETQGNKTRSVTLQALAAYLGSLSFDEITFEDESGTTYTINGAGSTLVRPAAGQGVPKLTIRQGAQGIKLSTSPQGTTNYTQLADGLVELFRKVSGLESGVSLDADGSIRVREQQRFGSDIVTFVTQLAATYVQSRELRMGNGFNISAVEQPQGDQTKQVNFGDLADERMLAAFRNIRVMGLLRVASLLVTGQAIFNNRLQVIGGINATGPVEALNIPAVLTSVGDPDPDGNYFEWQDPLNWRPGQVKLMTAQEIDTVIPIFLATNIEGDDARIETVLIGPDYVYSLMATGHSIEVPGVGWFEIFRMC